MVGISLVNYDIAYHYIHADGKTRALFGIIEYLSYSYKYYYLVSGILSLVLGLMVIRKNEIRPIDYFALVLSILSIIIVFIPIWKMMI